METNRDSAGKREKGTSFLTNVWNKIASWFAPEEVEVTFEEDGGGKVVSYTYTVVDHKHVA